MRLQKQKRRRVVCSIRLVERLLIAFLTLVSGLSIRALLTLEDSETIHAPPSLKPLTRVDGPLWRNSTVIPKWMKEYMDWQASVVPTLTEENWKNYQYVILRCYRADERCGGVSDRLKPIPLLVLAAQKGRRLFFIDWDRPCSLEEFLMPPTGGYDWRIPTHLRDTIHNEPNTFVATRAQNIIQHCQGKTKVFYTHIHDTQGGSTQYDEVNGPGSFSQVYHDLFRVFFQPAIGVRRKIASKVEMSGLRYGEYHVAHFRAEYGKEVIKHPKLSEPRFLQKVTVNAIKCASEFPTQHHVGNKGPTPIFFASDNTVAVERAKSLGEELNYPIVTFERSEASPLPLDKYNGSLSEIDPSLYYSTFADLYLAGNGDCVTHGRGGFGRFASLLSFNVSCSSKHVKQFFPVECKGKGPFSKVV